MKEQTEVKTGGGEIERKEETLYIRDERVGDPLLRTMAIEVENPNSDWGETYLVFLYLGAWKELPDNWTIVGIGVQWPDEYVGRRLKSDHRREGHCQIAAALGRPDSEFKERPYATVKALLDTHESLPKEFYDELFEAGLVLEAMQELRTRADALLTTL